MEVDFDTGLEKAALKAADNYNMHSIFAGDFESSIKYFKALKSKKHGDYPIQTAKVTHIYMKRFRLLTKEEMEMLSTRKYKILSQVFQQSVHEDLESFNDNCIHGRFQKEKAHTFFFQRLFDEEMQLVENKDELFFKSWNALHPIQPHVSDARMKMSSSKSKYLYAQCLRQSFILNQSADYETPYSCCDMMMSKWGL